MVVADCWEDRKALGHSAMNSTNCLEKNTLGAFAEMFYVTVLSVVKENL